MMVPKKLLIAGAALLCTGIVTSAQQGGSPMFRRVNKPVKSVSLDLQTGTITRGPVVGNKGFPGGFTTCASLNNTDSSGYVGVDSGLGAANGPCEWIDAADKGFGISGGKSGYLTGFTWLYCSAALDPLSGGPGGSTTIGFRTNYCKGTLANVGGPSGAVAGSFVLTGLPANTGCSSFFGGFTCYIISATFGNLPLCLPDGKIGWSWKFDDLGTDGTLAKTFPFLSCVQSCSGTGKDNVGMTDCVDQYCPAGGAITASFSFSTAVPYFTSISMQLEEALAAAASSVSDNPTAGACAANPGELTNTSAGVGAPVNAPVLGENYRVTLNCVAPAGTTGKLTIFRVAFAPPPPTMCTQWGNILVPITAGTGQNFFIPLPASKIANLGPIPLPKDLNLYQVCFRVQAFCPVTPAPGYLSNRLTETTGSN